MERATAGQLYAAQQVDAVGLAGQVVLVGLQSVPHLAELPVVGHHDGVQRRAAELSQQVLVKERQLQGVRRAPERSRPGPEVGGDLHPNTRSMYACPSAVSCGVSSSPTRSQKPMSSDSDDSA